MPICRVSLLSGSNILVRRFYTAMITRLPYIRAINTMAPSPITFAIHWYTGLLGQNIRQPIGGDFALSQQVYQYLLMQPWHRTTKEYGIDIFMTLNAILGGYRIAEVGLGAKIHKPSAPKLGPMFFQVVSTAFTVLSKQRQRWQDICQIRECPLFWPAQYSFAPKTGGRQGKNSPTGADRISAKRRDPFRVTDAAGTRRNRCYFCQRRS